MSDKKLKALKRKYVAPKKQPPMAGQVIGTVLLFGLVLSIFGLGFRFSSFYRVCSQITSAYATIGIDQTDRCIPRDIDAVQNVFDMEFENKLVSQLESQKMSLESQIRELSNDNHSLALQINYLNARVTTAPRMAGFDLPKQLEDLKFRNDELNQAVEEKKAESRAGIERLVALTDEYDFLDSEELTEAKNDVVELKSMLDGDITEPFDVLKVENGYTNTLKTVLNENGMITADVNLSEFIQYPHYTEEEFKTLLEGDTIGTFFDDEIFDSITAEVAPEALAAATARGYKPHGTIKSELLAEVDGQMLHKDAVVDYVEMKEAAASEGVNLIMSSGFRSVDDQAAIYEKILADNAGDYEKTIELVSIPGYSRHHTGLAVDINDVDYSVNGFSLTPAYEWLSKNNFLNAKKYGFLPSYPETEIEINFGPEPESWEYIWVGDLKL